MAVSPVCIMSPGSLRSPFPILSHLADSFQNPAEQWSSPQATQNQFPHADTTLTVQRLPLKSSDLVLKFLVPDAQSSPTQATSSLFSNCLASHLTYRKLSEPWSNVNDGKFTKRCAMEMASIESTFPSVADSRTILSMAAWLSYLCLMDDLVETMTVKDARLVLQKIQSILSTRRTLQQTVDIDASDITASDKLIHASDEFHRQTASLLPKAILQDFFLSIQEALLGFIEETAYRASPLPSLSTYLQLRKRTICVEPFLVLVRWSICGESHLSPATG